mmetsp:Transcript_10478/g.27487  ORF Transcript_10478/g.27487 Transcript_10478/m.27487 type:complete len:83 (-) Transcript_10478:204-452(-)|eukprot:CAMPEP_0174896904 /NCGR_PEP_ID=MMETSP0167-20121228/10982_1 /TAXON_ID=38298 /ORGANISM="Rhodella maculata, Strain CCMP736" /LENGTH=82 /DNA_ID=CAMNT_0016136585 /DNA_START=204 /DNA_END=452 /DNA_ORIENTATION=-
MNAAASASSPDASAAAPPTTFAAPTTPKPALAGTDERAAMRENALCAAEERQRAHARRGVPQGPKEKKSAEVEVAKIEDCMS